MNDYANITLHGPVQGDVVARLRESGRSAYVAGTVKGATVVFHADISLQESIARALSAELKCPALLVMTYSRRVLLYQLYESGALTDTYVSEHVEELLGATDAPPGDAERLCDAFGKPGAVRRVRSILAKVAKDGQPYAYAANRHGELLSALGLPVLAVAASFAAIEQGELPAGPGFEPARLERTT